VLVELLRQLSPLFSEEPEAMLYLFTRLDEVYELDLGGDRMFMGRVLPLVSGSLLAFMGRCLTRARQLGTM
jgi:hypothetical protein